MNITIKNLQKKIPIQPRRVRKAVLKALTLQGIKKSVDISISFVGNREIKKFNLKYTGSNRATDVLTFDSSRDKREILADIVISTDMALSNAKIYQTTPNYELYLYLIHGILHLTGYDDKDKRSRLAIEKRSRYLLKNVYP